ncbi:MAG: aminotransferase class V-fold PLP-dependent enzyme [Victivallaceae bacterium]
MDKKTSHIYFDNAAAAMPDSNVLSFFSNAAADNFANQEATHQLAYDVRQKLLNAAKILSKTLTGHDDHHVFWSNSGTDVFNTLSSVKQFSRGNIVTTELEHPALLAALKRSGAELRLAKTENGLISLASLTELLDEKTVLMAVHHVQSETGIIQPLAEIGRIVKENSPQALFMSDTIQSAGKLPLPWQEAQLDIIPVSGHKLGAPGGAALVIRKYLTELNACLKSCRSEQYLTGRPEPAQMLTLAYAVEIAGKQMQASAAKAADIKKHIREELEKISLRGGKKIIFTSPPENSSPYILHFLIPGYQGAVLARMLSEQNIYFSSGSACQAESNKPSPALTAMGYGKSDAYSGIRLSFWQNNTLDQAKLFVDAFKQALKDY